MTITNQSLYAKTLAELTSATSRSGSLPSLASSIERIHGAMSNAQATQAELVEAILCDVSLTQKVLRLANSAMYSAFGHSVQTVSEALVVLGTDAVGHLATNLQLFAQLDSLAQTTEAKAELSVAAATGSLARSLAQTASKGASAGEDVALLCLLNRLGALLVMLYLPESHKQISTLQKRGDSEASAEQTILGADSWHFGQAMVTQWRLPAMLSEMMDPLASSQDPHLAWAVAVRDFSRQVMVAASKPEANNSVAQLAIEYSDRIGIAPEELADVGSSALEHASAQEYVTALQELNAESSTSLRAGSSAALREALSELRLRSSSLKVNQLVSISLEQLTRTYRLNRCVFFLRNAQARKFSAKIALGQVAPELKVKLEFSEAFAPDVFHLAAANKKPVFLNDMQDAAIRRRIPQWHHTWLPDTRSALICPVQLGSGIAGLVYADWGTECMEESFTADDYQALDELCTLISAAFESLRRAATVSAVAA